MKYVLEIIAVFVSLAAFALSVFVYMWSVPYQETSRTAEVVSVLETSSRFIAQLPGQAYATSAESSGPVVSSSGDFLARSPAGDAHSFVANAAAVESLVLYGESLRDLDFELFSKAFLPILASRANSIDPSETLGALYAYSRLAGTLPVGQRTFQAPNLVRAECRPAIPLKLNQFVLSGADFTGAKLSKNCSLEGVVVQSGVFSETEFADPLRIESGDFSKSEFSRTKGASLTFAGDVILDGSKFHLVASVINFEGGTCRKCRFDAVSDGGQVNLSGVDLTEADLTGLPLRSGVSFVSNGTKLDWAVISKDQASRLFELNIGRPADPIGLPFNFDISPEAFALVVEDNPAAIGNESEPKYLLAGAIDNFTRSTENAISRRSRACESYGIPQMKAVLGINAKEVC